MVDDASGKRRPCRARARARAPRSARRHAGARRWRHGATSHAVTQVAREEHARARASCVINERSLGASAAPSAPIGRPSRSPRKLAYFVQ